MLTALVTKTQVNLSHSNSAERSGKVEVSGKQVIGFSLVDMLLISIRTFK